MRCPSCGHDNRPDGRFCTECGAVLFVACPSCGAPTEAGEKFCGGCGASLVGSGQSAVGSPPAPRPLTTNNLTTNNLPPGERRQLTVLFCDLVGSTPLSQQLDAEEWRDLIAQYQQAAAGAVARFGGHVAKNLGDGLLIYFGWPTARPEFTPPWPARSNLTTVQLARLAKRQAREMVERLVDAEILFARGEPPAGTRWKQSRVQSRELRVRRQRKGASTTPSI